MPMKPKKLNSLSKILRVENAGINSMPVKQNVDSCASLEFRIREILLLLNKNKFKSDDMIFFVMYDITNNKVRTQIAKYLIDKSCVRVQKSIFLVKASRPVFKEISDTLLEIQAMYENKDSILIVPVSTDEINAMKIIGENVDFDLVLKNKNTMFF